MGLNMGMVVLEPLIQLATTISRNGLYSLVWKFLSVDGFCPSTSSDLTTKKCDLGCNKVDTIQIWWLVDETLCFFLASPNWWFRRRYTTQTYEFKLAKMVVGPPEQDETAVTLDPAWNTFNSKTLSNSLVSFSSLEELRVMSQLLLIPLFHWQFSGNLGESHLFLKVIFTWCQKYKLEVMLNSSSWIPQIDGTTMVPNFFTIFWLCLREMGAPTMMVHHPYCMNQNMDYFKLFPPKNAPCLACVNKKTHLSDLSLQFRGLKPS